MDPTPPQEKDQRISGPMPVIPPTNAQIIDGVPVTTGSMPARPSIGKFLQPLFALIFIAALGYGGYWAWQNYKPAARPASTPAPISIEDAQAALSDMDGTLQEFDANMAGLDASLVDLQGDLSE
jgi:hypothetical protein